MKLQRGLPEPTSGGETHPLSREIQRFESIGAIRSDTPYRRLTWRNLKRREGLRGGIPQIHIRPARGSGSAGTPVLELLTANELGEPSKLVSPELRLVQSVPKGIFKLRQGFNCARIIPRAGSGS